MLTTPVIFVILSFNFLVICTADTGYYIPKSYYTIDANGRRSVEFLIPARLKRHIEQNAHSLNKRDSGSYSSSGSSSYAVGIPNFNSAPQDGGGFQNSPFPTNFFPPNFFPQNLFPSHFFPSNAFPVPNFSPPPNNNIGNTRDLTLVTSRFGDGEGTSGVINAPGIAVAGRSEGPNGSFSSSSTSINSDGQATYSVQNGYY